MNTAQRPGASVAAPPPVRITPANQVAKRPRWVVYRIPEAPRCLFAFSSRPSGRKGAYSSFQECLDALLHSAFSRHRFACCCSHSLSRERVFLPGCTCQPSLGRSRQQDPLISSHPRKPLPAIPTTRLSPRRPCCTTSDLETVRVTVQYGPACQCALRRLNRWNRTRVHPDTTWAEGLCF